MMFRLLLLFSIVCGVCLGHDWSTGRCPSPGSYYLRKFDMNKFLGKWFVRMKTDAGGNCWTLNFSMKNDGSLQVHEDRVLGIVSTFGSSSTYTSRGNINVPNWEKPSMMRVKFTRNIIGTADYVVVDTDYDNWGLIFMCQSKDLGFFTLKRQSAFLITRNLNYDYSSILPTVKKFLKNIKVEPLDKVKHSGCPSDHHVTVPPPPVPTLPSRGFTEDLREPQGNEYGGIISGQPVIITRRKRPQEVEWI